MVRINFDSLQLCEDLYNFQYNTFDLGNGLVDEVGAFYPMPIKARDLVVQGHYSMPLSEGAPDKLTKFNYKSYFEGVKIGYNEPLPNENVKVLEIATTDIVLKYTDVDKVCRNENAYDFGVAVGRLYHAWVYIADNVEKFTILLKQEQSSAEFLITAVERTRLIEIHKYLTDEKCIVVDVDSWLYWFSKYTWINGKKKPSKIKWIGAGYHLPNVIYLICGNMEKSTEKAMKNAFTLPSGKSFQKLTAKNIKGAFYKDIENMLKWAERHAIK